MASSPLPSSAQFGRAYNLAVANNSSALDLTSLHFKFTVKSSDLETPNTCIVRAYNASPTTVDALKSKEFTQLMLQAGYQNSVNFGIIFKWDLPTLCDPEAFYAALTSSRDYSAKPAIVPGDCEVIATDYAVEDCVVCATVVHSKREAHLVLLSSEDLTALRERLAGLQVALNSLQLLRKYRSAR